MEEDIFEGPSFALGRLGSNTFLLEYCEDFEKGLSGREHLHDNEGMLFPFNQKNKVSFHMKDCLMSLDIIFIKDGIIKKIFHDCQPCTDGNCTNFEDEDIDTVIELAGGSCKTNSIQEGLIYQLI
jgi:uncharacterized membrane protein (UPF0127 family)